MGRVNNSQQYFRCTSCRHRQLVRRFEWNRAKQPHCSSCGGPLELCDSRGAKSKTMNDHVLGLKQERKDVDNQDSHQ